MEMFAISDLHVGFKANLEALQGLRSHPEAVMVLAGDVGETSDHLAKALDVVQPRYREVVWCPGNHELWTVGKGSLAGEAKYRELVALCEQRGVLHPESEYPVWTIGYERFLIVPMFLLYDYTFCPDGVAPSDAVAWAAEAGLRCTDEELLSPEPYASREAWCAARCAETAQRIEQAQRATGLRTVLINHFPLRRELARLPAIPRFQIWCGTRQTEDWHRRFRAAVAISGHLHIRSSREIDGCRFEEVSLGYPRQWDTTRGINAFVRTIEPPPAAPAGV
jgi:predicted phosphodiesterase